MIEVRRAALVDAPAIAALVQETHAVHAEGLPRLFQPSDAVVLTAVEAAQQLATPGQVWFVALLASTPVGYAHGEIQVTAASRYKRPSARFHVHAMGVTAPARRQGVGHALLAAVRAEATAHDVAEISLEVYAFNAAARAFYASEGFAPVRELLAFPVRPVRD